MKCKSCNSHSANNNVRAAESLSQTQTHARCCCAQSLINCSARCDDGAPAPCWSSERDDAARARRACPKEPRPRLKPCSATQRAHRAEPSAAALRRSCTTTNEQQCRLDLVLPCSHAVSVGSSSASSPTYCSAPAAAACSSGRRRRPPTAAKLACRN